MKWILGIFLLVMLIPQCSKKQGTISPRLVGLWVSKNDSINKTLNLLSNGSYKAQKETNGIIEFPIQIGTWKSSSDSIYFSNMDKVDKDGNSIYIDTNINYIRSMGVGFILRNDSLFTYGMKPNSSEKIIFVREKSLQNKP